MCCPLCLAKAKFPGLHSNSTELAEGLIKGESRPSGCGPSALSLSRCKKGWDRREPHSEDMDTLLGHVAIVVCSHYALFLNLLNQRSTATFLGRQKKAA